MKKQKLVFSWGLTKKIFLFNLVDLTLSKRLLQMHRIGCNLSAFPNGKTKLYRYKKLAVNTNLTLYHLLHKQIEAKVKCPFNN